jgi:hypothetical protein
MLTIHSLLPLAPICLGFGVMFAFRAPAAEASPPSALKIPGLVAFWDFKEDAGQPRLSTGTKEKHPLQEVGGPIARVKGGPFSGYSAELNGKQYFRIPYSETGDLNIGGPEAQVSMFAVVRIVNLQQSRTIAGMWSEGKGANDDTGTRQYALLMNMPTYGGSRQLTPHISSEGGVTRRADGSAFPWCADYAATQSEVPEEQWCSLGFTYDGRYIRAYINGVFEERQPDPVKDKRTDRYFTLEGPGGTNRGVNPYYHGRGIFRYDPVQQALTKPGGGSDFTVGARYAVGSNLRQATIGQFGGLAVFNRALTAAEMKRLHDAANVAALPEPARVKTKPAPPSVAPHLRPPLAAPYANQVPFAHFITRRGDKLMDGNQEFRFIGANMPGLILPYDWTLYLPERLRLPTPWEQEDGFKTLDQMNLRVVRLWNLPIRDPKENTPDGKPTWHYIQGPGQFNDESFKVVDSLFALANRYGVRVIFDLTAESGDYLGGIGTYAAHRGKKRTDFYTDAQLKEDFKATIRHVLTRTNTLTGIPYREDKAILAWQFGNEMHSAPTAWLAEMAAYIKSLDANHLVSETRHQPGQPMIVDANIDLYTRHLYSYERGVGIGWPDVCRREMKSVQGQRPFFVGEFGPYIDGTALTQDNVVTRLREFLDFVINEDGVSGALIWSMYFHHQDGGYYWHQIMTYPRVWSFHWPGFPSAEAQREIGILQAMREAAFQIQGLVVPPVPAPEAPELLPCGDVPLLRWRGSAGATGYDIERASPAGGGWTVLATNISDADIAYRPLFSDTTARAGQTWFYRVTARNAFGASKPSKALGPVAVKRVCLVDELQDFSRVHAKSETLKLNNDYNALYAEYLFRAQGTTNDWITYQVPWPIESLKVVTFSAKDMAEFTLQVSADGRRFTPLNPERQVRRLPSPPGGAAGGQRRTLVQYESAVPAGNRFLKVEWNGPAELDRVEIYYR